MELEGAKSKQDIFESYVNKLNFGGSNNIRGIQKAAQYYFGKDLQECTLVEGALLAGVINAPNYYNPFYNLEAAQERVTEVLYQMKNHGYISKAEYELAKSVRVEPPACMASRSTSRTSVASRSSRGRDTLPAATVGEMRARYSASHT